VAPQSKPKRKGKKVYNTDHDETVTSTTSSHTDMAFVTPCVSKLTVDDNMTATGVTGRRLKDGEKYVSTLFMHYFMTFDTHTDLC